jgi:hypothetical protein
MTTPIRSTIFPGSRMTDPIRYIRFHTDRHDCECCGRVIAKGTLELSDGRRYGPQCAARAMGRAKLTGKEARRVAADYRFERHAYLTREGERLALEATSWAWVAKGYGGNVGWPETDLYTTADGTPLASVLTGSAVDAHFFDRRELLGLHPRSGRMFIRATMSALDALAAEMGARIYWTTWRGAGWRPGVGWEK